MVSFDLYPKPVANGSSNPASGDVVDLDGIDGFFDEYFAGRENGDIIHFVNTGPPGEWPTQRHQASSWLRAVSGIGSERADTPRWRCGNQRRAAAIPRHHSCGRHQYVLAFIGAGDPWLGS